MTRSILIIGFFVFAAGVTVASAWRPAATENGAAERMHHPLWIQENYFSPVYAAAATIPVAEEPVVSAIVNHHVFAPDLIAQTLQAISASRPPVILLISPDHFSKGSTTASTSSLAWQTMDGVVSADAALVAQLTAHPAITENIHALDGEHGIGNITSFLAQYFPGVPMVPLIISERAATTDIDALATFVNQQLPTNALIIGSFDFSHMQQLAVQEAHDAVSLDVLERVAFRETSALDIDSRNGLRLLLQLTTARGGTAFVKTGHSSSAARTRDPETTENTSYITGYYTAVP